MPLDAQASAFVTFVESLNGPALEDLPVDVCRRVSDEAWGSEPDGLTSIEELSIPGPKGDIGLRIYRPEVEGPLPVLIWFHGGGWVLGSYLVANHACEQLAVRTPCLVVAVDYGLSPENAFPGPIDDCWAATQWVSANLDKLGARPGPVAIGGDSAGGHLTAAVALRARDAGLPIALQLLVYPVTDGDTTKGSYREFETGFLLTKSAMDWFWDLFVGDVDRAHPEASVINADVKGVAPAWLLTAECDVLRDEGEAYGAKLKAAGVPVTMHRHPGQLHGFFTLKGLFDATGVVQDMAAQQLRAAFSA